MMPDNRKHFLKVNKWQTIVNTIFLIMHKMILKCLDILLTALHSVTFVYIEHRIKIVQNINYINIAVLFATDLVF